MTGQAPTTGQAATDQASEDGVTGVVLAAGAGVRFGGPKAVARVDGQRLIDRAVAVLRAGGCTPVVAVVRSGTTVADAVVIANPDPDRGLGSSFRLGLDAASGRRAVVLLVDVPGVTAEAVVRVAAAPGPVAIATYRGRRGHPVAIDRACWAEAAALATGGDGARAFLRARPELVTEVPCDGDPADLDTLADLERWLAGRHIRRR